MNRRRRWNSVRTLALAIMTLAVLAPATLAQQSRVFVTSSSLIGGDRGGLAGADATCNAFANGAGLGGVWVAWLSNSTVNARDRVPNLPGPDAFIRAAGPPATIADDLADLTDGTLQNAIQYSEQGTLIPSRAVWTGTTDAGSLRNSCNNWTDATAAFRGTTGFTDFANVAWTQHRDNPCDSFAAHLYCFEVPPPAVPATSHAAVALIALILMAGLAYALRHAWAG